MTFLTRMCEREGYIANDVKNPIFANDGHLLRDNALRLFLSARTRALMITLNRQVRS
jgi:hypothetical protein